MADYLFVVTRYVDGANCSGVSYFGIFSDEDEPMDVSADHANTDEQVAALLIELGNLSVEEISLLAQPLVEQDKEPIKENLSLEEEEEIIQEPVQALITQEEEIVEEIVQTPNEKEVVKSPDVRTEGSQEKEAKVCLPEIIRSEGEPLKDKDDEESSSSEGEQDQNARTVKSLPFPDINAGNLYENILNPLHNKSNLYERFQRAEEELEEKERNKTGNESEKDEPEQSLQTHTQFDPIQTSEVDEIPTYLSSEECGNYGIKYGKDFKDPEEDRKEFAEYVKILKELDNILKKNSRQFEMMSLERQINLDNHREIIESMELFKSQMIEIQGSLRGSDDERLEYADSIARKFREKENAKAVAEKEQTRITQGEPSRRGDGISTNTRSKRAPTNDENLRPTKRGGGRSGGDLRGLSSGGRGGQSGCDRGGRTSGGDRGGRSSGSGRGGRVLPPFQNLLTGEGMSYEGTRFLIDPRVKREEQ
ncbi:keratin, type II cytoskeletal 1-like [Impatiens glandulifera]|uniref:keratin, type II cytoskeletal 1-like n=1 Tax=Impatiens glandulifera TaxID=253017 RepID=UPI001FB19052|nr:keratin, type II cytoskeletal 1-like [Impatiens glandulifera]